MNHFSKDAFSLDVKPIDCPDNYTLKQLFLLSRHGSRLPNLDQIAGFDKIDKAFANVSVSKDWPKNPFPPEKNFRLTTRGKLEPYYNGLQSLRRYEKFWKTVEYDADVVKFQTANAFWIGQSTMSFAEGLLDGTGPIGTCKNEPVFMCHDYLLEMWSACPRWNQTVGSNFALYTEQTYSYGNKTLAPIAERLTKKYNINPPLDPKLVPYLYYYCDFYVLQFNRTDTWCGLLSDDDLIFGRYYWNMRSYYQYSYGNPLNEQLGCAFVTQFVNSVEDYLNGKSRMVADLKFAHGFTDYVVLTTLGVFKNEYPLTADLTLEQMKSLKYIEQKAFYWSSTIYFEIYTSPGKDALLRLVVNFDPYIIPGCDEYCEWSKFKNILGSKINCDFEKLCAYP
ncbi:25055_t:CDS:2 [Cetraspora pellucida]|uniref:Multiple inositol polyphosphate phosphatase 1 n=1 Tax=Cetraspora pellucida TaxID=1433469 RepID=A0A9N8W1J4_9GLOM|nr:25055_t:CDS:2 [Cetraspora pellucida]